MYPNFSALGSKLKKIVNRKPCRLLEAEIVAGATNFSVVVTTAHSFGRALIHWSLSNCRCADRSIAHGTWTTTVVRAARGCKNDVVLAIFAGWRLESAGDVLIVLLRTERGLRAARGCKNDVVLAIFAGWRLEPAGSRAQTVQCSVPFQHTH
jgi:hypothetical protein